jgi:hypothetical protein
MPFPYRLPYFSNNTKMIGKIWKTGLEKPGIFLTIFTLIDLLSLYIGDGRRLGEQVVNGLRLLTTHDW